MAVLRRHELRMPKMADSASTGARRHRDGYREDRCFRGYDVPTAATVIQRFRGPLGHRQLALAYGRRGWGFSHEPTSRLAFVVLLAFVFARLDRGGFHRTFLQRSSIGASAAWPT